jgi:hypothetical protein
VKVAGEVQEALRRRDGVQGVGREEPLHRQPLLAHRLEQRVLAQLDGLFAAFDVEVLPDLVRARGLLTKPSQSCVGPDVSDFDVKISITSPLDSVDSSGTSLPLTFAPMHLCPTSVRTAYAKPTGVDPDGNAITSPSQVKTYTSWLDRSNRNASRTPTGWPPRAARTKQQPLVHQ